jgi:hypothetical protein
VRLPSSATPRRFGGRLWDAVLTSMIIGSVIASPSCFIVPLRSLPLAPATSSVKHIGQASLPQSVACSAHGGSAGEHGPWLTTSRHHRLTIHSSRTRFARRLNSGVRPVVSNPYKPPQSHPVDGPIPGRRWTHVVAAFLSAIFIPALLAYGTPVLWSSDYHVAVKPEAIATVVIGAIISAVAVYRHKRIPLWVAALVGVLVVLLLAVAPSIWDALLGRGAA